MHGGSAVTTTELLLPGASGWTSGARLGKGLNGARAVNSGGSIFLYGGDDNDDNQFYEVGHFRETAVTPKHLCNQLKQDEVVELVCFQIFKLNEDNQSWDVVRRIYK